MSSSSTAADTAGAGGGDGGGGGSGSGGSSKVLNSLKASVVPGESKRTDFPLMPSKTALLIIDIQDYLSKPSGSQDEGDNSYFYETSLPRTVQNLRKLVAVMRKKRDEKSDGGDGGDDSGCEVIFTYLEALTNDCRDVSLDYKLSGPQLSTGLPNGASNPATFLADLAPRRRDGKGDIVIPKTSCSVFVSTNLHYVLQNLRVEQLVVAGQLTDQCVESAVRDAADLGYFVSVVRDACAARTEASHEKGLAGMGGFCRTVSTEQIIHELENPPSKSIVEFPTKTSVAAKTDATAVAAKEQPPPPAATTSATSGISIVPTSDFRPPTATSDPSSIIRSFHTALKYAGIKFLRFLVVDAANTVRCKVIPVSHWRADSTVSIATVCFAGFPSFADYLQPESGLDARGVLRIEPDYGTLRILPYAPRTALVMGTAHDVTTGELSPLCTRGLLSRVVETAKSTHGIHFNVGAELEFCLHDSKTGEPLDDSVFANTTTLNQREEFIDAVVDQLERQDIGIELLHSESSPAQLELVLRYSSDPVSLADQVVCARETISAVSRSFGYKALFLPKIHGDKAGNGLHVHLSFGTESNPNAFECPRGDAEGNDMPSREGRSFLEGILARLPALLAITLPSANSFRRMGPGCWTGHDAVWDVEDKEVPLRLCRDLRSRRVTNVEYKLSDASGNIHLSLACILSCAFEGYATQRVLRPSLSSSSKSPKSSLPTDFPSALKCLEKDEFLTTILGPELTRGYLAIRRCEAARSAEASLEDEVAEALAKC